VQHIIKLAEALLLRSDLVKKLASLQSRAQRFAMVQEGEKPAEGPRDLFVRIDVVAGAHITLMVPAIPACPESRRSIGSSPVAPSGKL
jgi:hypothetical protein